LRERAAHIDIAFNHETDCHIISTHQTPDGASRRVGVKAPQLSPTAQSRVYAIAVNRSANVEYLHLSQNSFQRMPGQVVLLSWYQKYPACSTNGGSSAKFQFVIEDSLAA
jgi:hypothetical protein